MKYEVRNQHGTLIAEPDNSETGRIFVTVEDSYGNQIGVSSCSDGTFRVGSWDKWGEWVELDLNRDGEPFDISAWHHCEEMATSEANDWLPWSDESNPRVMTHRPEPPKDPRQASIENMLDNLPEGPTGRYFRRSLLRLAADFGFTLPERYTA